MRSPASDAADERAAPSVGAPADVALLEREGEINQLSAAVADARQGTGTLAIIEGPAGIGKTALLEHARDRAARSGMRVLTARATALEQTFAYGIVRQLLEREVADLPGARRQRLLGGAAAPARFLVEPAADLRAGDGRSYAVRHALYQLLAGLSRERPVLVAIDDFHWADPASAGWVGHVVLRLAQLPVLLLLAARDGWQDVHVLPTAESASAVRIRPRALSSPSCGLLARRALAGEPDPEFAAACQRATGGNPFLLHSLLSEAASRRMAPVAAAADAVCALGAEPVVRSVSTRIALCSAACAASLAEHLAVLGEADVTLLAQVTGHPRSAVLDALTELVVADLVADSEPARFTHPVLRSSLYESIPRARRQELHRRCARALADSLAVDAACSHLHACPGAGEPWAVDLLHEAGRRALAHGAAETARTHLRRAVEEDPARASPELLFDVGRAELQLADPAATEHLTAACQRLSEPEGRARAAIALATAHRIHNQPASAYDVLDRAARELGDGGQDLGLLLDATLMHTLRSSLSSSGLVSGRLADRASDLTGASSGERAALCVASGDAVLRGEAADGVAQLATTGLADGRVLDDEWYLFSAVAGAALVWIDRYGPAESHLRAMCAAAQRCGDPAAYVYAATFLTHAARRRGALAEASAHGTRALELARASGLKFQAALTYGYLGEVLLAQGASEDLTALLAEYDELGFPCDLAPHSLVLHLRAVRLLDAGRDQEALPLLQEVGERMHAWHAGNSPSVLPWRSSLARAYRATGADDEAEQLAREELELARRVGAPRAVGIACTTLGVVGNPDGAGDLLRDAVATLARCGARVEQATAALELGAYLRRAGQRVGAREPLREALHLADAAGARALAARVREELLLAGARPRRSALTGPDSLTPAEARVARLAAEGLTNRAIAQRLSVTPRTVEMHLGNAYRKLGIAGRDGLAGLDVLDEPVQVAADSSASHGTRAATAG